MSTPREPGSEPPSEMERELHALYRDLRPPPPADEASEADPTTRQVVQWMRGAWQALEAPPSTRPGELRPRPRALPARRWVVPAAAAALLLLAGGALWRALGVPGEPAFPARLAQAPAAPPEATPDAPAHDAVEILGVHPDRVELRSGNVRLVLLAPPPSDAPSEM